MIKFQIAYDQDNAEWSSGMRGKRMIQPIDLTNWLVLFCQRNGREAWDFIQTLKRVGPPMGMNFQDPKM